jgi:hypothetical protein
LGRTTSRMGFSEFRIPFRRAKRNAPDRNDLMLARVLLERSFCAAISSSSRSPSRVLKLRNGVFKRLADAPGFGNLDTCSPTC